MKLPDPPVRLTSGRLIRLVPAVVGLAVLGAILYNATMVDRVPPTYVIRVSSLSEDGKALILTAVNVAFSKEVQHDSAEAAFSISPPVAGSFHWQGRTMTWTPDDRLPLSTTFKVHIAAGVRDVDGNTQTGTGDVSFTTVGPPRVVAVSPAANATAVAVDGAIRVTFDRLMDTEKVVAGLRVDPAFAFAASWNAEVLTLTPSQPLAPATRYTLTIGSPAVDSDGSALESWSTTFTTVGIGLRVRALVPTAGVAGVSVHSPIAIEFDGPLDPTSVEGAITLTPPVSGATTVASLPSDRAPSSATGTSPSAGSTTSPGATAVATPSASGVLAGNVLVFTPDGALAPHTTYTVTMSSKVRRTNGEAATAQAWSFTTGEPPVNALNQISFISARGGVANVWIMNPDGSNQRQVTTELVPVTAFDISGDGATIAYAAGGVVKKMAVTGGSPTTITASGTFEYAPTFTPSGTGLVVGRRGADGTDLGYWLVPLISGSDQRRLTPDGAPPLGSVDSPQPGLTGSAGEPAWWSRAAFTQDGGVMLIVRGSDSVLELVDMSGVASPVRIGLIGNSRPVWLQARDAFYVTGALSPASTWAYWSVDLAGRTAALGWASGDLDFNGSILAFVAQGADGQNHVTTSAPAGGTPVQLTAGSTYVDAAPSFSPDASEIVFARVDAANPTTSAGIWVVSTDGTGLASLAVDGTCPRWLP